VRHSFLQTVSTPLMHKTLDRRAPPRYNEEERSQQSGDVQAGSHIADESKEGAPGDADLT